jgi:glycosyltransferase involved in cell wall biosynthesis
MDPVDEVIFQPGDKTEARRHFDLPLDKKIIFFGAQTLSERRKGMIYLIQALSILRINPEYKKLWDSVHLLIAGKNISQIKPYLEFDYSYKGMLSIDNELPRAFQAADVFVCPSIEDSGPMMINQSVMCGTPVVAFEMGVALDLVHAGKTGYRAVLKDSDDFARGIYHILTLSPAKLDQMRKNCRELGLSKVTPSAQVDIIEKILLENEHRF